MIEGAGDSEVDLIITAEVENLILAHIQRETGIRIQDHQRDRMRESIHSSCVNSGYLSSRELLDELLEHRIRVQLFDELVDIVTVSESYFFRDEQQFEYLRDRFLPDLIAQRREAGSRTLRIWSAGCARGQEVYSIAILLHELLPDADDWNMRLIGTDISTRCLIDARVGKYRSWDFRCTDPILTQKYFRETDGDYELIPDVRKMAHFFALNLVRDPYPTIFNETNEHDLILCRNVFIYFEPEAAAAALRRLTSSLRPGGVLLLGASEGISWTLPDNLITEAAGLRCYARVTPVTGRGNTSLAASGHEPAPSVGSTAGAAASASAPSRDGAARMEPDGAAFATRRGGDELTHVFSAAAGRQADARTADDSLRTELDARLGCGDWSQALDLIEDAIADNGETAPLLVARAKALANLGRFTDAVAACERALTEDPTDKRGYLIYGLVLSSLGEESGAEFAFRRAIFLDPRFLEAHYQIALVLLSTNRTAEGLKSLGNALRIAEDGDPESAICDAPGMTFGRFAEIVRAELEIYSGGYQR